MASGDTLAVFIPQANEPPSSNYATFDTRNGILVLDFDGTTSESAVFRGILPGNYAGGGLTLVIYWMAGSKTLAYLTGLFGANSATKAALNALQAPPISRAAELGFQAVAHTDVAEARRGNN